MKQLLAILIILGGFLLCKELFLTYKSVKKEAVASERAGGVPPVPAAPTALPGLPLSLEATLKASEKKGAEGLRNFLNLYGRNIRDPRLAAIELDYVVLVSRHDPAEAQRIFRAVQERTPSSSPIYERIKRLEKTYQ